MSSNVIFTYEEDSLFADYPCMFDLKHSIYKDPLIKENIWKEIAKCLNKSVKCIYLS